MRNPFDIEIDRLKVRAATDMGLLRNDLDQAMALVGESDPGNAATRIQSVIASASMLLQSLSAWHAMQEGKTFADIPSE